MAGTVRPLSSAAVPSITISVNKADAERFMKASDAIATEFAKFSVDKKLSVSSTVQPRGEEKQGMDTFVPLHETIHQAALACKEEAVAVYNNRLGASALSPFERKASFLLFYKSEFEEKLKAVCRAFASSNVGSGAGVDHGLQRNDILSLFRTLLTSITCCSGTETTRSIVVEGKPEAAAEEPPKKKVRREEDNATASTMDSTQPNTTSSNPAANKEELQASSFDTSLATLQDDDQHQIQSPQHQTALPKEIEDVAVFATEQILGFAKEKSLENVVSARTLNQWFVEKGKYVAPWLELLSVSKWKQVAQGHDKQSSPSLDKENKRVQLPGGEPRTMDHQIDFNKDTLFDEPPKNDPFAANAAMQDTSKPLVSFDFSGSGHPKPLCIEISENNLFALRNFVHRTGLMHYPASSMCKKLLRLANRRMNGSETVLTLTRDAWMGSIGEILGGEVWAQLSSVEREAFTGCFTEIFSCFEGNKAVLRNDEVDLQEFAVGFCFFCSGNKSSKLATGFEVLDDKRANYLTENHLRRYLTSYLTMLVAMSVLAPISNHNATGVVAHRHHREMRSAVESGAKWTLGHFLRQYGGRSSSGHPHQNRYSFESFASWYSSGGFEIAPWLELLDLNKVFSLIDRSGFDMMPPHSLASNARDKMSSLRRHHSNKKVHPPAILFTFPLANHQSLVVLKEDATYVSSVVEQLGLLSMNPNELWSKLSKLVEKKKKAADAKQGAVYVSMETFLSCMDEICPTLRSFKPGHPERTQTSELLSNFFQCFDLEQRNSVAADELMGGLTLLCGGKKSHKLAFAFGVFDTRPGIHLKKKKETIIHSLSGEDLFLFLRSILIVTFSCCRQSLDMSDDMVGRCIADTANMICNDVMRHQWEKRQKDRLNFDEFGQWYNDGGFERAPWLELLDLKKWVLVEEPLDSIKTRQDRSSAPETTKPAASAPAPTLSLSSDPVIPPPPPEDELDPDFFESTIMPMDSIDEMDMILMQPSTDKDIDLGSPRISRSFSHSPELPLPSPHPSTSASKPPLKFFLSTKDEHGGYNLSMSHSRINHLRSLLEASSLHKMEASVVCHRILAKATKSKNPKLSQEAFDSAIGSIVCSNHPESREDEHSLFSVLAGIFSSFDRDGSGRVNAIEVACGFTVLCSGKKSDKLEFAFDVLDKRKRGRLSRDDMTNYLKSFLTVLLSISFSNHLKDDTSQESALTTMQGHPCDPVRSLMTVVEASASWATSMAFQGHSEHHDPDKSTSMSFDDFADWYTKKGFTSIPWLELLDLKKWIF